MSKLLYIPSGKLLSYYSAPEKEEAVLTQEMLNYLMSFLLSLKHTREANNQWLEYYGVSIPVLREELEIIEDD